MSRQLHLTANYSIDIAASSHIAAGWNSHFLFECLSLYCSSMKNERVIERIAVAFSKVKLGKGIGLWQAQAIDDYENKEVQQRERKKDIKENWKSISSADLQRCHSSLSFFDPDGMRFHLPAYIIGSINGEVDDPIFHLTYFDGWTKFTSLNTEQMGAVAVYLEWCMNNPVYEYDKPIIERALIEYWL